MTCAVPSVRTVLAVALTLAAAFAGRPASSAIDPAGAAAYFREARLICDRDGGRFWGVSLCGPMLITDPNDRSVIANQADPGGVLKPSDGFYTGVLPPEVIVANTPIEWSGTRWTELMWPLRAHVGEELDAAALHVTLAHELFHRVQPDLGLMRPEVSNQHLDTFDGRYLLQLEWRALATALQAKAPAARRAAIADSLLFRRERYRLFPEAAAAEAALEIDEGVPEYTGVRLGLESPEARIAYAVRDLSAFVDAPTFVRSFAYATGPAYGLLLDQADPQWRTKLHSGKSFDELLSTALQLPAPDFSRLKAREAAYDDGALRTREGTREAARQARLAALKAKLVDGPVLMLPLHKANYQFNPQTLVPLGEYGTVYPTMRLVSDWGVLEVEDGALLDKEMKTAWVSAAAIDSSGLKGPGWRLVLNSGWAVKPAARTGDWTVSRTDGAAH